jgi:hypothetical integral membrane protein (TIGR02206 family)
VPGAAEGRRAVFTAWSPSHLVVLAIFAAGTVGLLLVGPRVRGRPSARRLSVALAVGNIVFGIASAVTELFPFSARHSLPLQICDFAWIFVAWGLLSTRRLPVALTYYWGLTLSVQALVQPTLTEPFPQLDFFVFWGKHVLIIWGAVFLCLSLRRGPDWWSYRRAVGWTVVWLVFVMCLNPLLGSNYGYVNGKPSEATVLDLLGPWPLYVVAEMVIVTGFWALITLPWVRQASEERVSR